MFKLEKTPTPTKSTPVQTKFAQVQAINRVATALDKFKAVVKSFTSTENGHVVLKSNFKNY